MGVPKFFEFSSVRNVKFCKSSPPPQRLADIPKVSACNVRTLSSLPVDYTYLLSYILYLYIKAKALTD